MITVLSSATSERLVHVADVKDALNITDNKDDAALGKFTDRASGRIARYCQRSFGVELVEAILPGPGGTILQLPHRNIRTVFSVHDGTDTGQAALSSTEYRVDKERGWLYREGGWPWTFQETNGIAFQPEIGQDYLNWRVEYSHGFVLPGGKCSTWDGTTATGQSVPAELEDATIMLVRRSWLGRDRDQSIQSERVGELSVSYRDQSQESLKGGVPSDVADILTPFRSVI